MLTHSNSPNLSMLLLPPLHLTAALGFSLYVALKGHALTTYQEQVDILRLRAWGRSFIN